MQDEAIFYFCRGLKWEIRHSPRNFFNFIQHQRDLPEFWLSHFSILFRILTRNRGINGLTNVDRQLRQMYRD